MNEAVAAIQGEHLQRLFFFALKKTGNRMEAEELAQETAYEAILTLSKGRFPDDFDSWLWGVAKKRYARWAKARHIRLTAFEDAGADGAEKHPALQVNDLEDGLLRGEQTDLLRRELALLSKEYREIVVAYYLEGRGIAPISEATGLPEGTIKRKLHESRQLLKEGMRMARRNGQRSYAPENVDFTKSGRDGQDGSPWSKIDRSIPKNILLEAYNNPSTVEELSLSLGVASPYMEEEAAILAEATLLRTLDDGRYETDFIIISKEMQEANFTSIVEAGDALAPLLLEHLDARLADIRGIGFHGSAMPTEDLYWLLLPWAVDFICGVAREPKAVPRGYTSRPRGGAWDITGYEHCELSIALATGLNGSGDSWTSSFRTYKIRMQSLWDRAGELDVQSTAMLVDIVRTGRRAPELTAPEKGVIDKLAERGFITYGDDGQILPTFPVFNESEKAELGKMNSVFVKTCVDKLTSMVSKLFDTILDRVLSEIPARLEGQAKFVASDCLYDLRMVVLRHALAEGRIGLPADVGKSTIAMMMTV